MSQLTRDEGVSQYFESHKLAGYGFMTLVFEAVAERMEAKGHQCAATYSKAEWARITRSSARNVDRYMDGLQIIEWINVSVENGKYRVEIPKMVDWRDEYTRKKSGQTPDTDRTKSHRVERDQIKQRKDQKQALEEMKQKLSRT